MQICIDVIFAQNCFCYSAIFVNQTIKKPAVGVNITFYLSLLIEE